MHKLIAAANQLDEEKQYTQSDSITKYLLNLAHSKTLQKISLNSDIPTKLLMLEKAGVDTSEFYNKLADATISDKDVDDINQKIEVNCPGKTPDKKDTDLHEYVLYVNKKKSPQEDQDQEEFNNYLETLRESFVDFLTDIVMKDFEKENREITPQNLINFYFENRDKYEDELDKYNLMIGQTEGIISDQDFVEDLSDDIDNDGEMVRRGEENA